MDHLQSNIFIAGQRLNDLTGYSGIEALKREIEQQGEMRKSALPRIPGANAPTEQLVQDTRSTLQKVRGDYSAAIAQRSGSQREVNELLQRKHAWTPNDLERFTTLYRSDHANEQAEIAAQASLTAVEKEAEEAGAKLSACILARYHEEQIWSDKIRRMSTWGTWGLMGVNILLFLVFQIGVEPWRRKRLVKGFEDKVMEALEREGGLGAPLAEVQVVPDIATVEVDRIEDAEIATAAAEEVLSEPEAPSQEVFSNAMEVPALEEVEKSSEPAKPVSTSQSVRERIRDMFSEQEILVRRVDLTTAMIEGAAAGVAFVGVIVFALRPK